MPELAGEAVLITGLTGLLGPYVARSLQALGASVRGLARHAAGGAFPWPLELGALDDPAALRRALSGAGTVVHLAARVHVMHETAADPLGSYRAVNVDGTARLLEAASRAGVRRFVLVSSVKAAGERADRTLTETMPARPADPYGISKLEAEHLVVAWAEAQGVHSAILRLPLIYGAGMRGNMRRLFELVQRGIPLPFGAVRNQRSLVYAGNAADAVAAVLTTEAARNELFYASDGRDVSTAELTRAIGSALGRRARLFAVPPALLAGAARAGDVVARAVPCPVTSAMLERLVGSLTVDITKLRTVTGYTPRMTLAAGLAETACWYRCALP